MISRFLRKCKSRKIIKKNKETEEDIKRGKAVLELIDNYLLKIGQTRKQRKKFWNEFINSQNVRSNVYSTIENALEGETKYKKENNAK